MIIRKQILLTSIAAAMALTVGNGVRAQSASQSSSDYATKTNDLHSAALPESSEKDAQQLKVDDQELSQQVTDANKASKLIGMTVKNQKNEQLGTIRDFALDLRSGKVAYAVLAHGATLGFGGKNIAIPFQSLTVKPGEKALLLDIDKQELARAPGFEDKAWPNLNAAAQGKTIGLVGHGDTNSTSKAIGGSESTGESTQSGFRSRSDHFLSDTNAPAASTNSASEK